MTYNDPNSSRSDANWSTGAIAGMAIGAVLIVGGIIYALSHRDTSTASNGSTGGTSTASQSSPATPSTSGAGGTTRP